MKASIVCTVVFMCSIFCAACDEKKQQNNDSLSEQSQDTVFSLSDNELNLDSIRNLSSEKFEEVMAMDNTPPQKPSLKKGSACIPCDIDFLVYLNSKSDYTMEDVKRLLCLDDQDQCVDNAEFTQFYNEMIFKVFQRERNDFTDAELNTLLKDMELIEELSQPVNDVHSITLLKELKADAKNPKD